MQFASRYTQMRVESTLCHSGCLAGSNVVHDRTLTNVCYQQTAEKSEFDDARMSTLFGLATYTLIAPATHIVCTVF